MRVGSTVILSERGVSRWGRWGSDESNPLNTLGVIIYMHGFSVGVEWPIGRHNTYEKKDLTVIPEGLSTLLEGFEE